jgi:hypothetical protein
MSSQPIPLWGGPPPQIPVYSRADQLDNAAAGDLCSYKDMISLVSYAGTVTAVTKNVSITVTVPNLPAGATPGPSPLTFPLTPMDGALALPIGLLK